ncbi:MAG TPA: M15 family metallopeptidase [Gemmatimonadales bacterium]|jgi:D-alanyl-D-alanine dipeptidase
MKSVPACIVAVALLARPLVAQKTANPATQANAVEQPVAADSLARGALADLRSIPGLRFELRYATSVNFTGAVLPGYGAAVPLLRREAVRALGAVQRRLAARGLGLKVWDGYRPVRATLGMVAWCERNGRVDLLDSGYIARRSRHNQGVAIDLTVVNLATGRELPMGTGFDAFNARAHTANATGQEAANRALLGDAMRRAGFVNYVGEWWHFSFDVPDPVPYDLALERW